MNKLTDAAKGQAMGGAKSLAKDFHPNEIAKSGIFNKDKMQSAASGGFADFGRKFLEALIPPAEKVGEILALQTGVAKKDAVKDVGAEAFSSGLMDQVSSAKARGRRASSTAKKCSEPTCNKFHFRMDGYCADHKHLSPEFNATQVDSQTAALLKSAEGNADATENLVHGLKAIALREEMMARAETYDVEISVDSIHDAKAALKGIQQTVDDVELGQIYYQFKRLDVDADGFFTVTDFNTWIYRVDPDFKTEEGTVEQWLRRETVDGSDQFDFINYYHMLMARRDFEDNNWGHPLDVVVPMELKQTPFWDLRMIVLHALLNQERCGWMLKRGYLFTKESMNSWKLRYMRTNTQRPYEPPTLEYWDADPNIDPSKVTEGQTMPQMKGSLPLRDIVLVDFSPKTPSPKGTDTALLAAMGKVGMTSENETVMKITLVNGRRYTFACEQDKAVTWAAELSRHAAASRMMLDWRENWGTKRIGAVTLRDWLNAAIVIAKIGKSPQILEDAKKIIAAANNKFTVLPGSKAAAVTAANQQALQFVKDAVLSEREVMFLRVVGINEVNLDKMTGVVLLGVKALVLAQNKLKEYDTAMCHGIGQKVVQGAQDAVNVYMYAAAAKNAYNTSKFKVEWQSKNQERACGVCHQVFKSMTLRKTHGKHHCRACGKVVCHVCSANRIFMTVSNKFERVCTKCLTDNANREVREIDANATVFGAVVNVAANAAVTAIVGDGDGDEDSSDDSGGEN